MIDPDTRAKFDQAVTRARREGRDLGEVLDEAALLLTVVRREQVAQQGLTDLGEAFDRRDPSAFMIRHHGRADGSPQDMHTAVAAFLHAHINSKQVDLPRHRGHRA